MEVGEYVRTRNYGICKITGFESKNVFFADYAMGYVIKTKEIVKHSKNIIELIEEGDYVNGEKVINTWNGNRIETHRSNFDEEDIKSIVTKEQFKLIEYEV